MDRRVQAASINRDLKSEQISDLVALAQKGDQDAFRTIYEEYVGQIYALCLRFTADPVKAEDRTQSAFIRAWEKLDTYRGEGGFIHWLKKLTTNLIFQEQRADKRRSLRLLVTDDPAAYEKPTSTLPESKIDLERAIARLPDAPGRVCRVHGSDG